MAKSGNLEKYLPLTESTFFILASLSEPMHGYAIMQKVEQLSHGEVKIGAGTIYGAFSMLEKEKIIRMVAEENRRKVYELTDKGRQILLMQIERLNLMLGFVSRHEASWKRGENGAGN